MTDQPAAVQVHKIYIKAKPQAIWDAITRPEWSEKYAYGGRVSYELKKNGTYFHEASAEMKAFGVPEKCILGKVEESDPPRKLVQTWHPQFSPEMIAEKPSRLTWEIREHEGGFCTLTLTHDTAGAPQVAGMVRGNDEPNQGGGGWPWVLSDLKSLLETGKRMAG